MTSQETHDNETPDVGFQQAWDKRWKIELCSAIARIENCCHPPHCAEWDDEDCDCGIHEALVHLWPTVGANPIFGRVEDLNHPLRLMRTARQIVAQLNGVRP